MHPEISHQEKRTTAKIVEILKELNCEVQEFDDMTGVVGLIKGAQNGPTIGLRADIDALPIEELNEVPYKSQNPGVMHACGHDAHTTIMLGVAKNIIESGLQTELKGKVKFFFQPAEERVAGAKAMIERGVLENPRVDRVIAGHMAPDVPVGKIGICRGLGYASADRFKLQITGKGSHGARPEDGYDPIVAGANFVTTIQSIVSRNIKPTEAAVVTVGKFRSGDASNVIPEFAYLEGSIRALSGAIRQKIFDRLYEIAAGLEKTFNVVCSLNIHEGVPTLENDIEVAEFLYKVSQHILGTNNVQYFPPVMGSEDFSYFTEQRPSAIMRLGCSNSEKGLERSLHSPYFDIDEQVLDVGVAIFTEAVVRYLS
ncbi:MAG: amidohydrolase [Deltaproteobacteria bacterium]|nr:amidohydrolase [Deltaproteobacteria bacterium]